MTKILMREAETLVPVARSTFRKHAKQGKFSTDQNAQGLQIVDVAELQRYYGRLNTNGDDRQTETPEIDGNRQVETQLDATPVVELLRDQLAQTKVELTDAKEREKRLLSMLEMEQQKTQMLMLSPPRPTLTEGIGKLFAKLRANRHKKGVSKDFLGYPQ